MPLFAPKFQPVTCCFMFRLVLVPRSWLVTIYSLVRVLVLSVTLLLTVLLPLGTNGAPRTAAVELDATHVSLPKPLTDAVSTALAQRPSGLMKGTHFRITSAEVDNDWAVVSVVSIDEQIDHTDETEQEHALHSHGGTKLGGFSKLVVARQQWHGGWDAALDGTPAFAALANRAPADVLSNDAKQILGVTTTQFTAASTQTAGATTSSVTPNADNGDLVIDNSESSFTFAGDLSDAACGVGNTTRWTWASSADDSITNDAAGVWRPNVPTSGQYKVLVHIPSCSGITNLTTNARYEIVHSGGKANVTINQQAQRGWIELGTWNFGMGTNGYVRLTDLTSESYADRRAIMFDAVQWVAANQAPQPSATPAPSSSPTPLPTPPPGPVVDYEFPWPAGQSWGYWQGWHYNANDLGTTSTDRRVLAAADGVVSSIYACTLSTIIDIKHADGAVFRYIHIDRYSVNPKYIKLGKPIKQGQVLGVLKPDTWSDGNCGYTNQSQGWSHLHWVMPTDRPLTIDGWTTQHPTNTWTKDSATRTPSYSSSKLTSTNQPIPSYHERVFVPMVQTMAVPPSNPYP